MRRGKCLTSTSEKRIKTNHANKPNSMARDLIGSTSTAQNETNIYSSNGDDNDDDDGNNYG